MTNFALRWSRALLTVILVAGFSLLLGGCGGAPAQAQKAVELLSVGSPMREPVWVDKPNFAIALRADEPRVVKFNASAGAPGESTLGPGALESSGVLEGVGQNMAPNHLKEDEVYTAQPDLGRIAQIDPTTLRKTGYFDVGGDPEWVAVHPGSQTLFALSRDGSTLTEVDLRDPKKTFSFDINAGEGAHIDTPQRGIEPELWTWGPGGIAYYNGFPPEQKVGMPVNAGAFAVDIETAQRAYVGEGASGRVIAVEGDPQGILEGKLKEMAEQDLGEPAEHLEAEDLRVFAVTQNKLVAMKRDNLDILDTVEFRSFLDQQGLGDARVSGMTVTGDRVYVTLEGQPYILSLRKTDKTH
jgi:hypothetical protein